MLELVPGGGVLVGVEAEERDSLRRLVREGCSTGPLTTRILSAGYPVLSTFRRTSAVEVTSSSRAWGPAMR